tara:strand:- start:2294 stop:3367 length:1074 start_codon:yes stop_codon:yes gene_type:complete
MSQFIFPPLTASLDSEASDGGSLPSAIMVVGGYDGSAVQVIKTDSDGNLQVDLLSSTTVTVTGTVTLGAGTAAFGKLSANSGVDIGDVDVTSLPALPAGTNSIGTVILGAGTAAFGKLSANSGVDIGDVDVTSLPSIPAGTNSIGTVILGAGTAAIGKLAANSGVDIGDVTLNAGTAVIGKLAANSGVDIGDVTLNAGTAEIGKLAAGTASIGTVGLNAGSNAIGKLAANSGVDIGDVDVTSLPALPSGTNTIGTVVVGAIAPVDFLDSGLVNTSTANIAATGTTVVSSLAAACNEIEIQEDIGEFMSMRVGGTVKAYLPLGGGRVKVTLAATDAVQLFSETGTAISSGKIAINFLG